MCYKSSLSHMKSRHHGPNLPLLTRAPPQRRSSPDALPTVTDAQLVGIPP